MSKVGIRAMTLADVDATVRVQIDGFADLERRLGEESAPLTDDRLDRFHRRHEHFVRHDPDGAFVATVDGDVVGCALALRRESLWGLSLLVVAPGAQSSGAGRKLLDAALAYADGCERAVIMSSPDPRAIRSYGTSGFDLFPQVRASGTPDLVARPPRDRQVRDGGVDDGHLADAIDHQVRGAGRAPDRELMASSPMFVVDDADGSGYAHMRDGDVYLLAATNDATATALLWHCFTHARERDLKVTVEHITGEQQWAIEACLAARLTVKPAGPVFWRGTTPPPSYLPSGGFL